MTYNDIVKFIDDFRVGSLVLPEEIKRKLEEQVPEIVYALTNEKGRNRKERANETYYKGIRDTRFSVVHKDVRPVGEYTIYDDVRLREPYA